MRGWRRFRFRELDWLPCTNRSGWRTRWPWSAAEGTWRASWVCVGMKGCWLEVGSNGSGWSNGKCCVTKKRRKNIRKVRELNGMKGWRERPGKAAECIGRTWWKWWMRQRKMCVVFRVDAANPWMIGHERELNEMREEIERLISERNSMQERINPRRRLRAWKRGGGELARLEREWVVVKEQLGRARRNMR